jgi:hypothetical protein
VSDQPIRVVLDTSAVIGYAHGSINVGESHRRGHRRGRGSLCHGVAVLLRVYPNCVSGQQGPTNDRIDGALGE